jgi:DNA-binding GntR family transcriptional regulator
MLIDPLSARPIYVQIAAVVAERIRSGEYEPDRAIPSEPDLSAEFGVARNTVRAAVRLLGERGLIVTVRGKGSFVVPEPPADVDF